MTIGSALSRKEVSPEGLEPQKGKKDISMCKIGGGGDVIDCRTSHELLQSYSMLEAKIVILQLAMDCSCGTCFPSSFVSTLSVSLRVFTQFLYFN